MRLLWTLLVTLALVWAGPRSVATGGHARGDLACWAPVLPASDDAAEVTHEVQHGSKDPCQLGWLDDDEPASGDLFLDPPRPVQEHRLPVRGQAPARSEIRARAGGAPEPPPPRLAT